MNSRIALLLCSFSLCSIALTGCNSGGGSDPLEGADTNAARNATDEPIDTPSTPTSDPVPDPTPDSTPEPEPDPVATCEETDTCAPSIEYACEEDNSCSKEVLKMGEYNVGYRFWTLVDKSRVTPETGVPKKNSRTLNTVVWYPTKNGVVPKKRMPLIVYNHGFTSFHFEGNHINRILASHGYIVVSYNAVSSSLFTPSDQVSEYDIVNIPGDISFLIRHMLKLDSQSQDRRFYQRIDEDRIGLIGLSLGSVTSIMTGFLQADKSKALPGKEDLAQWRDPKVNLVVAMAPSIFPAQCSPKSIPSILSRFADLYTFFPILETVTNKDIPKTPDNPDGVPHDSENYLAAKMAFARCAAAFREIQSYAVDYPTGTDMPYGRTDSDEVEAQGESGVHDSDINFLIMHGTSDAFLDYVNKALVVFKNAKVKDKNFLTAKDGSHAGWGGFTQIFDFAKHTDVPACGYIGDSVSDSAGNLCAQVDGTSIKASRQQVLGRLSTVSFIRSRFDKPGYDQQFMTYYFDNLLTQENGELILSKTDEDIPGLIEACQRDYHCSMDPDYYNPCYLDNAEYRAELLEFLKAQFGDDEAISDSVEVLLKKKTELLSGGCKP